MSARSIKIVNRRTLRLFAAIVGFSLILAGLYILFLLKAPDKHPLSPSRQRNFIVKTPVSSGEQLIIPKISLKVKISSYGISSLRTGIWHRYPERGNPEIGGNMVLAAHRYVLAYTPGRVIDRSFFYNLPKLQKNDDVYVDWHSKRYGYKVTQIISVKPNQTEIEEESSFPKLTIYTCNLAGSTDGRVGVIAEPK